MGLARAKVRREKSAIVNFIVVAERVGYYQVIGLATERIQGLFDGFYMCFKEM